MEQVLGMETVLPVAILAATVDRRHRKQLKLHPDNSQDRTEQES